MKLRGKWGLLFVCSIMLLTNSVLSAPKTNKKYIVRVLLDECVAYSPNRWDVQARRGFVLIDPKHPDKKIYCKKEQLRIDVQRGFIYVDKKRYRRDVLYIKPIDGFLEHGGNEYHGSFLVAKHKEKAYLINCVDLEDYLFGVLRTESWPGWPLEVNKVFAITSRTYAISMMQEAKRTKRIFHVRNTNAHQTYEGRHTNAVLQQAVDHTKGLFLAYENKPITAMFDSCCGGIIPAHIDGINFEKAPYLARPYACTHCKPCGIYNWTFELAVKDFEKKLDKTRIAQVKKVKNARISKKDKAGLVQELQLRGQRGVAHVTGKELYSWFKDIKSFHYTTKRKGDLLVFSGRGYGHHLGLCQWGAREMVRNGWDHKSILNYYYPGTSFMRLQ